MDDGTLALEGPIDLYADFDGRGVVEVEHDVVAVLAQPGRRIGKEAPDLVEHRPPLLSGYRGRTMVAIEPMARQAPRRLR